MAGGRKFLPGIFLICLLTLTLTLIPVSASDWFVVKDTQSFAVLKGEAKLTIKPTANNTIKPAAMLTDPKEVKNLREMQEVVRKPGWYPVRTVLPQNYVKSGYGWKCYRGWCWGSWWNGQHTFIVRDRPFEYEANVQFDRVPLAGPAKLYLNDHELGKLTSSHVKLVVTPDRDKMIAKLYLGSKLAKELDVTNEKVYKFHMKVPVDKNKYRRYLEWAFRVVNQRIVEYSYFEEEKTLLKPGYYVVHEEKLPDKIVSKKKFCPGGVLITRSGPFEYRASISVHFVTGGCAKTDLWLNSIHLTTLGSWCRHNLGGVGGGWNIHFKLQPSDGKMVGVLYVNGRFVKTVDLSAFDQYTLRVTTSGCSWRYTSSFTVKNIVVKEYEYVGSGDLIKVTVSNGVRDIPVSGYSSAKVVASTGVKNVKKCDWFRCWIAKVPDPPIKTIFEAINTRDNKVLSSVTNSGILSLEGADAIRIKVFRGTADVFIMLEGRKEGSNSTEYQFTIATVTLPLTDKEFEVKGETTIDLTPYLVPGLNPVIISPAIPVEVKLDVKPNNASTKLAEKVIVTRAWHTFSDADIGEHTITATATNEYGLSAKDSVRVRVSDKLDRDEPPTVRIVKPSSDVVLPGNVEFEVSASDDRGVTIVKLYLNGEIVAEDVFGDKTVTLKHVENLATGTYEIRAEAYDTSYQKGETSMTITVRNVKFPAIKKIIIHSPDVWGRTHEYTFDGVPGGQCAFGNTYAAGSDIIVEAIVQKGDYDIAYVRFGSIDNLEDRRSDDPCTYYNQNKPPKYWWFASPSILTEPPYITSVYVFHPWGKYVGVEEQSITAMVCDVKGFCSWETVKIAGLERDDKPPQVSILKPSNGETLSGEYTIRVWAKDDRAVRKVWLWMYAIDGRIKSYSLGHAKLVSGTEKDGTWELNYDFSDVEPGKYKIKAVATDSSGNSASATVTVYVGTVVPTPAPTHTPTPTPTPTPTLTPTLTPTPACSITASITSGNVFRDACVNNEEVTRGYVIYSTTASGGCRVKEVKAYLDGREIYHKTMSIPTINTEDTVWFDISGFEKGSEHRIKVVAVSTTGQIATDEKVFEICSPQSMPTETPVPLPDKIPLYAVSINSLDYFAGEYKGIVYTFGYYNPSMGEGALFADPVYNRDVETTYHIQLSKPKAGVYEFDPANFNDGITKITESPWCSYYYNKQSGGSYVISCG